MITKSWSLEKFLGLYGLETTQQAYRFVLQSFLKSVKPDLDGATSEATDDFSIAYIEGIKNDEYDLENDLIKFSQSGGFGKGKSPVTKLGYIKKWLEANKIMISPHVKKSIIRNTIVGEQYTPTREELARIIDHLDLPYKALTLVLVSSGVRISEALAFKMEDVDFSTQPIKIKHSKRSNDKKGRAKFVFITEEAGCALKSWMNRRDELMLKMREKANQTFDPSDDRIFPFSYPTYLGSFDTARKKAGLGEVNEYGRSLVIIHGLRKYFATFFSSEEVADALMGHKRGTVSTYRKLKDRPNYVEEEYQKSIPNLTISDEWRAKLKVDEKVEVLERNNTALENDLEIRAARQSAVINQLVSTIDEMKKTYEFSVTDLTKTLDDKMAEMDRFMATFKHDPEKDMSDGDRDRIFPKLKEA